MAPYFVSLNSPFGQQFREAELVSVRISDMKEALTPGRILRRLNCQSLCPRCPVMRVHAINAKNGSAPHLCSYPALAAKFTKALPAFRLLKAALSPPYTNSNPSLL